MAKADVRLPRLPVLVSVAGTVQHPIRDLTLSGFRFSHTSWTGPSEHGYANQQSGTFITGQSKAFPADPLGTCQQGCPEFENERSEEHTSELQSLMRISYAVFCLQKKNNV